MVELVPPALKAWNLAHWTTREVLRILFLKLMKIGQQILLSASAVAVIHSVFFVFALKNFLNLY